LRPFGKEYEDYMKRTGRLFPKVIIMANCPHCKAILGFSSGKWTS